jgi:hypothetical protein
MYSRRAFFWFAALRFVSPPHGTLRDGRYKAMFCVL